MSIVLVTGATGFVGSHCVVAALNAGHRVRGTVRSLSRVTEVRTMVEAGGARNVDRLEFVEADLTHDDGWAEATAGCDYVLHTASPFPARQPDDPDELIRPARDGVLRVLRAARAAAVHRVVLTSSFAAIGYGHGLADRVFDEEDWTNVDATDVQPYMRSKTLAERAAWDFVGEHGRRPELCVVNPVGIFGPALGPDVSASLGLVVALLNGGMPGAPRLYFGVVDVRDVAELHLLAMTSPAAAGQRFIAAAGDVTSLHEIARALRSGLGDQASRVPADELSDAEVRRLAGSSPAMAGMVPQLGIVRRFTAAKATRTLGWRPRGASEAVMASARSLIALGVVHPAP
jgi:dihydroflavonol-4-reductase